MAEVEEIRMAAAARAGVGAHEAPPFRRGKRCPQREAPVVALHRGVVLPWVCGSRRWPAGVRWILGLAPSGCAASTPGEGPPFPTQPLTQRADVSRRERRYALLFKVAPHRKESRWRLPRPPRREGRVNAFPYVWRVRCRLPERHGQRCRVLVSG